MPEPTDLSSDLIDYQRQLQSIIIKHQTGRIDDQIDKFFEAKNGDHLSKSEAGRANQLVYGAFHEFLAGKNSPLGEGAEILISSFRSRRGVGKTFLRTLHSDPEHVAKIFNAPSDASSFQFTRATFGNYPDIGYVQDEALKYHGFIRGYSISECKAAQSTSTEFPYRIWDFLNKEELNAYFHELDKLEPGQQQNLENIKNDGSCIVFARTELVVHQNVNNTDHLQDLVALYFSKPSFKFEDGQREKLCRVIGITLTAFSQIERFDKEAFRRDAMTKITKLIPQFSDKLTAPAMNMSKLLEELKHSFQKHPYFGTSTDPEDINIRFVRFDFLKETAKGKDNKNILPKLEIYPPAYASVVALDATYFSHRHSRSVVKYLLGTWLERLGKIVIEGAVYKAHKDFIASNDSKTGPSGPTFSCLNKDGNWSLEDTACKAVPPIGIYATALNDREFWNSHNFRATTDEAGAVTTAGYLMFKAKSDDVRGNKVGAKKRNDTKLPFGVIAFESKVPDAFSEEDLRILHEISVAVSHLIDLNGWSDVHIDYQTKIRKAMIRDKFGAGKANGLNEDLKDIAFELERSDRRTLEDWLGDKALEQENPLALDEGQETNTKWQAAFRQMSHVVARSRGLEQVESDTIFHQALLSLRVFHTKNTKSDANGSIPTIFGTESPSRLWLRPPLDLFAKNHDAEGDFELPENEEEKSLLVSVIKEFLESLPPQEEWNARLSAIPRALLSRSLKNPILSKFPTGFSAEAIYVLDDHREIRQILKFSDRESISNERDNYQDFVRYHIPLAARMPQDGFAYDNNGYPPIESEKANSEGYFEKRKKAIAEKASEGFGVLVSDLVAGDQSQDNVIGENENSIPHSLENKLFDLVVNSTNSNTGDTREFLQALSNHFVWKSIKWEDPSIRSFGSDFKVWRKKIAKEDFGRVILDSSRLKQFSDEVRGKEERYFDTQQPYGTLEKQSSEEDREKNIEQAEGAVFDFLSSCEASFEKSIQKYNGFIENYTESVGFDYIDLRKADPTFVEAKGVNDILSRALAAVSDDQPMIKKSQLHKLISVTHGDSHGRNMTWSEEFRQFQMIDFEHVRFGYVFSDQIKLIVSTLTQFVATSFTQTSQYNEQEEDRIAKDFEESIIALTSFSEGLSECAKVQNKKSNLSIVAKRLNRNFFNRSFDLGEKKSLLHLRKKIEEIRHTNDGLPSESVEGDRELNAEEKRQKIIEKFLTDEPRSRILTRTIRRILGSCFHLPAIGSNESHNLKTIDLETLDPAKITRDTNSNALFFGTFQRALKAFALKEFSYQLRNLEVQDIARIEGWNSINKACTETVEFMEELNTDEVLSKFEVDDEEALRSASRKRRVSFDGHCARKRQSAETNNRESETDTQLFDSFKIPRIKHLVRRKLGMFPKRYVQKNHPDEKIVALASSYLVMLALFRYE